MSEDLELAERPRYFWHCSGCYAYVARELESCDCGGIKADRIVQHFRQISEADVRPRPPDRWQLILYALTSFGLLWFFLG